MKSRIFSLIVTLTFLIIVMGASYALIDPFGVIFKDPNQSIIATNREYISLHNYLKSKSQNIDSFILGSSRTLGFNPKDWQTYLPTNSIAFSFDSSAENYEGIYQKLLYLEDSNTKMKNVLIVLCPDTFFEESQEHYLFRKHYLLSGESYIDYHITFFRAFYNPKLVLSLFKYLFESESEKSRNILFRSSSRITYDKMNNHIELIGIQQRIQTDSVSYYQSLEKEFSQALSISKSEYKPRIGREILSKLIEIQSILDNSETDYKVVISPLWSKLKIHPDDLKVINSIFKAENVFDFSGKNQFTSNQSNYYESSHFKESVGKKILKIIYK